MVGAVGAAGVLAELFFPPFPDGLFGLACLACIVAVYGVMILRGRRRGEGVLTTLSIQYGSRLSGFERAAFIVIGGLVVSVFILFDFELSSLLYVAIGAYMMYLGVSGTPPYGAGESRDADRGAG